MEELRSNPAFLAREREREAQQQANREAYASAARPVLEELRSLGFAVDSVRDLRVQGKPYPRAVPVLLAWLPRIADRYVKEDIIRTLSVPWAHPEAAPALLRELKESTDESLRWVIGNALEVVADESSFDDLRGLANDRSLGRAREMLVLAMGKLHDRRVVPTLIGLLADDELVGHALVALRRSKASVDPAVISPLTSHPKEWVRNEARELLREMGR
jgi:hypothetical protein